MKAGHKKSLKTGQAQKHGEPFIPRTQNSDLSHKITKAKPQPTQQVTADTFARKTEDLDKIRDILFGQQVQAQDQRFAQLEQTLTEECARLRTTFNQRFDNLEAQINEQIEQLWQRLNNEETSRKNSIADLRRSLCESEKAADRARDRLSETLADNHQNLQADIKDQISVLRASFEEEIEALLTQIEAETSERKVSHSTARTELSALFAGLSKQLEVAETPSSDN